MLGCTSTETEKKSQEAGDEQELQGPFLVVLGTVQDAGSPHLNCKKECCAELLKNPDPSRKVVSLAVVDPDNEKKYLFEASPDIRSQLASLNELDGFESNDFPDAIFITHAHIGHYTGLMYLGRESANADSVPVYTMPRMKSFIENNGPWSQLVNLGNIVPKTLDTSRNIQIGSVTVECFLVPHRDEYSETVGFRIKGPNKSVLFIPDIDKWHKWDKNIIEYISSVDYAFLDATFYDGEEIRQRDISEIPHPFVIESMALFDGLPDAEKQKIHFIHLNHTNPLLNSDSEQHKRVISKKYNISSYLDRVQL